MNLALYAYKTTLSHLPIANVAEFHKVNVEQIEPHAANVTGLGTAFDAYKIAVEALSAAYFQQPKSIETELMVLKDDMRDTTVKYYLATIDYHFKYPQNEAEKEAIYKLKFVADTYRNAPRKDYQAETTAIRSLIRDTRRLTAEVALFDLAKILDRLEQENKGFEALHMIRTQALEKKRERGAATHFAVKANKAFDTMAQIINGLYLMKELDTQSRPSLLQIISILKGQIHAYKIIYDRHAGINSSNNKDEGGNEPDEPGDFQTPDINDQLKIEN